MSHGQNVTVDVPFGSKCHSGHGELGRNVQAADSCCIVHHKVAQMNDLIQGNKQRSRGHTVQYSIQGADHTAVPIDIHNSRKDVWIKKEIVE